MANPAVFNLFYQQYWKETYPNGIPKGMKPSTVLQVAAAKVWQFFVVTATAC